MKKKEEKRNKKKKEWRRNGQMWTEEDKSERDSIKTNKNAHLCFRNKIDLEILRTKK